MVQTARLSLFIVIMLVLIPYGLAQQKGQWLPGQSGLNAGVLPEPGFTYANLTIHYSADSMKDSNGHSIPVQGNYGFWAIENNFFFVPNFEFLGGHFALLADVPTANGSLTVPQFGVSAGGHGLADVWLQPATLGWHLRRADTYVAYAFMAPVGRYTPGATDNVGSGYWGHHFVTGTTAYLTKNKGTSLNLTTDWEFHGQKTGSNVTPGQAFTTEWGFGQILPLDKQMKKLLQLGLIGYDQWQVSANGGTVGPGVPASLVPYYSVHAVGFQSNFIVPAKGLSLFFKYEPEYRARAHSQGTTIVFGASWTLRIPRSSSRP
ncbi:MAG: transporter [Acidobacteriia bacterium]|nr:transporter [Terriglobia bacterium]